MMATDVENLEKDLDAIVDFPEGEDIIKEVIQKNTQMSNRANRLKNSAKLNKRKLQFREPSPRCNIIKPSQLADKWQERFESSKKDKD